MKYFTFSPLEMSKEEAYEKAKSKLKAEHIVHITARGSWLEPISVGKRPRAIQDTFLMRVESDDSLRQVDSCFS